MKASVPFIEERFAHFNTMCFGGVLPAIPVILTRARSFVGKFTGKVQRNFWGREVRTGNYTIRISSLFDLEESQWEDVIIHEMIHYYIAYTGLRDSSAHGREFRRLMHSINSGFGRNITVRHRIEDGQLPPSPPDTSVNYLCISLLHNSNYGITRCSQAKVKQIDRMLNRRYHIISKGWYVCSDQYFKKYPSSRKAVIYKISKDELDIHLEGADKFSPKDLYDR